MKNALYEEIDKLRADNKRLLEACRSAETHYSVVCEIICADNPPPGGYPVLKQLRAAIVAAGGRE